MWNCGIDKTRQRAYNTCRTTQFNTQSNRTIEYITQRRVSHKESGEPVPYRGESGNGGVSSNPSPTANSAGAAGRFLKYSSCGTQCAAAFLLRQPRKPILPSKCSHFMRTYAHTSILSHPEALEGRRVRLSLNTRIFAAAYFDGAQHAIAAHIIGELLPTYLAIDYSDCITRSVESGNILPIMPERPARTQQKYWFRGIRQKYCNQLCESPNTYGTTLLDS